VTDLLVRYRGPRPAICGGCGLRPTEPGQRLCRYCLDLSAADPGHRSIRCRTSPRQTAVPLGQRDVLTRVASEGEHDVSADRLLLRLGQGYRAAVIGPRIAVQKLDARDVRMVAGNDVERSTHSPVASQRSIRRLAGRVALGLRQCPAGGQEREHYDARGRRALRLHAASVCVDATRRPELRYGMGRGEGSTRDSGRLRDPEPAFRLLTTDERKSRTQT
jgi:hypothetical protein